MNHDQLSSTAANLHALLFCRLQAMGISDLHPHGASRVL